MIRRRGNTQKITHSTFYRLQILHLVSTYFMLTFKFNSYHSLMGYDNIPYVVISLISHNSVTTQYLWFFRRTFWKVLKCYNFLWVQRRHDCSPAASFANCVMTLYLLKVYLQTFLSIPITQKNDKLWVVALLSQMNDIHFWGNVLQVFSQHMLVMCSSDIYHITQCHTP